MTTSAGEQWYFQTGHGREGPVGIRAVSDRIKSQEIRRETLVWHATMADWTPAGQVAALEEAFAFLPPPLEGRLSAAEMAPPNGQDRAEVPTSVAAAMPPPPGVPPASATPAQSAPDGAPSPDSVLCRKCLTWNGTWNDVTADHCVNCGAALPPPGSFLRWWRGPVYLRVWHTILILAIAMLAGLLSPALVGRPLGPKTGLGIYLIVLLALHVGLGSRLKQSTWEPAIPEPVPIRFLQGDCPPGLSIVIFAALLVTGFVIAGTSVPWWITMTLRHDLSIASWWALPTSLVFVVLLAGIGAIASAVKSGSPYRIPIIVGVTILIAAYMRTVYASFSL